MSNKTQILCNVGNTEYSLMLKDNWIRIERDTSKIADIEKERRKLILIILVIKQNKISVPPYLYNRLAELPHMIEYYKETIREYWEFKRLFERRLVIC